MAEKKTRRKSGQHSGAGPKSFQGLQIGQIKPKTENQERAFDSYYSGKHLLLHGVAGTGKTLVSMYLALRDIDAGLYEKVVIVRSAVPTRDMGFLPGGLREKSQPYEAPFMSACFDIYGRGDAYEILKQKGIVEFITTSFIRGITLHNCVIILDETQNMRWHEIDSVVTRVGQNSRIIAIGDFKQSDLTRSDDRRGITDFIRVTEAMPSFDLVEFGYDDILRSSTVKEFLMTRDKLGITD